MVWSPMSNLLLYGATSRVKSARDNGVRIGLGSDWAVSGSKNLLGELKSHASRAMRWTPASPTASSSRWPRATRHRSSAGTRCSDRFGEVLAPISLSSTATPADPVQGARQRGRNGAVARDDQRRPSFRHDVAHDPPGAEGERIKVGGRQRSLFMDQTSADEVVADISLGQAKTTLVDALRRLPELASDLGNSRSGPARAMIDWLARSGPPIWFLALDELEPTGSELRPRLPGAEGRRQRATSRDDADGARDTALATGRPDDARSADRRRRRRFPRSGGGADGVAGDVRRNLKGNARKSKSDV